MPAAPETAGVTTARLPSQRGDGTAVARTGSGHYWVRLLPVLAVLAALTRLPSFLRPIWNPDEGFLATQARMLAHGGVLYDTVVDRKPPLLPWLYQGAFWLFGDASLTPLRIAAVLAQLVTAALLAALARRRWGNLAGATAGIGHLLVSVGLSPEDSQAATFEVFMLPWTVAAFLCADLARGRSAARWGALAGLAVAGAALTKQTGGAVLLPVVWLLWRSGPGRARALGGLAVGFLVPGLAVALVLGAHRFLFWTVTGSGSYLSVSGAWLVAVGRALGNTGILAAACAGAVVPALYLLARRRRFAESDLWIWLAASAVAVTTGFQFYGHYYLQLLPPLVLLGVAALRRLPRWWRPAAGWTALAACGFTVWGLAAPHGDLDHASRVAAAIAHRTAPGETVLVWGMHPEDYWLSGRAPASRYLTAGFLTNFSGGRGGARVGEEYAVPGAWRTFRQEMERRPPALIVDDSRGQPYGPAHIPAFRHLLAGYHRTATADGAVLYVRRS
ncbi:ArnT family glycosyltransferase [Streptomyces sp. RPT161]|uniref:ArnT family glycosyltransferase n=1 Tax=Streptomyces sp. RPT161 TaxID=3015993 RepID=UPI0022B8A599|nr:glycosyltransferase family 39 protein [Streptomyces sp. RPT161]